MSVDTDVKILFDEVKVEPIVTIPIEKTLEAKLRNDFEASAVVSNNVEHNIDEPARRVDSFSHSSESSYIDVHARRTPLTLAQSKAFILKNHWKTPILNYPFRDAQGRINVYEFITLPINEL